MIEKVVVTRHRSLYNYLIKHKFIDRDVLKIAYADVKDIKGKHVFGILPLRLSCHAAKFTEVQLRLPIGKRSDELTDAEVEDYAIPPKTYIIREVKEDE